MQSFGTNAPSDLGVHLTIGGSGTIAPFIAQIPFIRSLTLDRASADIGIPPGADMVVFEDLNILGGIFRSNFDALTVNRHTNIGKGGVLILDLPVGETGVTHTLGAAPYTGLATDPTIQNNGHISFRGDLINGEEQTLVFNAAYLPGTGTLQSNAMSNLEVYAQYSINMPPSVRELNELVMDIANPATLALTEVPPPAGSPAGTPST